jgi:hypothetical protein
MKGILFSLLLIVLFCSLRCKPENNNSEPIKPYDPRDQFIGLYSVENDSGYTYWMQISKIDSAGERYLQINNFANLFPKLLSNYGGFFSPLNFFSIPQYYGIKDKYNRTWHLSGENDDTTTSVRENVLANNQIILYYRLQNMPWWSAEGVPYHFAFHKHIATKIY